MSGIRDDLEKAFAESSAADEPKPAADTSIDEGQKEQQAEPEPEAKPDTKLAGDDGTTSPITPATNEVPADKEPKQEVAEQFRAPISWKPEAREEWAKLPTTAQREIVRREREIDETLRRTAGERRVAQEFQQAIAPYQQLLQAENATPVQAVQTLMNTAALLRTAPAPQRAQLVADMIHQYGVDISLLDERLAARASGQQPQFDTSIIDQKLAPVTQFINQFKGQQQSSMQAEVANTWNQFANDPANEFAHDVREDMADLLQMSAQRGQTLSLQDAYNRATMAHPTIAQIIMQRRTAHAAAQQTAAARRAKEASASISSGGAPSREAEEDDGSIRSAIAASVSTLSKRT